MPFTRLFIEIDSTVIRFSAYHQHEFGPLDFLVAPGGPSFRGQHFVLVKTCIYAVGPQPIGEVEHTILMLGAVVAITDEYPRRCLFRHWKLPKPSSRLFEN